MSHIPAILYADLWGNKQSVRSPISHAPDAEEFLELAPRVPIKTRTIPYPLANANETLGALRQGRVQGAAVLVPNR
jgi:propanol-preferring alcohol dehydrogenase